ncbi:hypothetical protein AX16_004832 [Volvariella volvacea WC 439]|nr:hypothetical protein AX16_004832 [Volvariella volvacea WC 439]
MSNHHYAQYNYEPSGSGPPNLQRSPVNHTIRTRVNLASQVPSSCIANLSVPPNVVSMPTHVDQSYADYHLGQLQTGQENQYRSSMHRPHFRRPELPPPSTHNSTNPLQFSNYPPISDAIVSSMQFYPRYVVLYSNIEGNYQPSLVYKPQIPVTAFSAPAFTPPSSIAVGGYYSNLPQTGLSSTFNDDPIVPRQDITQHAPDIQCLPGVDQCRLAPGVHGHIYTSTHIPCIPSSSALIPSNSNLGDTALASDGVHSSNTPQNIQASLYHPANMHLLAGGSQSQLQAESQLQPPIHQQNSQTFLSFTMSAGASNAEVNTTSLNTLNTGSTFAQPEMQVNQKCRLDTNFIL